MSNDQTDPTPTSPSSLDCAQRAAKHAMTPREPRVGQLVIDAREVAYLTGRSYYEVRAWAQSGELPTIQFPPTAILRKRKGRPAARKHHRLLFDRRDVEAFIAKWKVA